MFVKDIMNDQPLSIEQDALLNIAIPLMVERESSYLIVVEHKRPIGIITERDITRLVSRVLENPELMDAPVESIMTPKPLCVYSGSTFKDALMISRSHHLRHLPVVNEHYELNGIVTQDNLVDSFIRLMAEHDQLESNLENLKLLSLEDPLTGVGNRRAMEVELKHSQAQSERLKNAYAIALLDIDFFKKFNDYYGHQAGDDALRKVSICAKNSLREADRFFRYGGEEFLILMPGATDDEALVCAERVRSEVESLALENHDTDRGILTVSLGVISTVAGDWQHMLKQADKALYRAKSQGRNTVVLV
jgi:diguanylate cyclase (GGDEF)-like protein|tara:strand:+ start:3361 stop:4278 length:918 start_codon:yes stop_codon:yes gene_type:complete